MKLAELGEFGLIKRIAENIDDTLLQNSIGIGDDCAVIQKNEKESYLITTDMLIEDIHFLKKHIKAEELGNKALAVNLSDVAAMGGKPHWIFLSLALPAKTKIAWTDRFFKGFLELAEMSGCLLLGGDTTHSKKNIIINVVVIGEIETEKIKFRNKAKIGDVICTTDLVGNSGCGLKLLLENKFDPTIQAHRSMLQAHHLPKANLQEGSWLADFPEVHAMIDISDGVDSDVLQIIKNSQVGAQLFLEKLPLASQMKKIAEKFNWNVEELAISSGEDYCLIVTIAPSAFPDIAKKFQKHFGRNLNFIGKITDSKKLEVIEKGKKIDLIQKGYDHFRSEEK